MKTFLIFIIISVSFTNCNGQEKDSSKMQSKSIEQVLRENQDMLLAIPGVQGFYQGILEDGSGCIVIMIDTLSEENEEKLPRTLEGYPVKIEEGGEIKPLYKKEHKSSPEE